MDCPVTRSLDTAWQRVRRLLVIRLDNIGDIILLGPALRLIKRQIPEAQLTLLASPVGAEASELITGIDRRRSLRAVWQDAFAELPLNPGREIDLINELRAGEFDAAIIFTSFSQSVFPPAYACYLAGIPIRAGMSNDFGGSLLSHRIPSPPWGMHQAERNLYLLEQLGFGFEPPRPVIKIPAAAHQKADDLLSAHGISLGAPFVAIVPGASCEARRWEIGRFMRLAELTLERTRLPVVLLGRPHEIPDCDIAGVHVLSGETTITDFAAILSRAALVVANNSAAMHLAEACGRPSVILFSGTDLESQWRPKETRSVLLRRSTPCAPCYRFRCPFQMECLAFEAEEVLPHVVRILSERMANYGAPDSSPA